MMVLYVPYQLCNHWRECGIQRAYEDLYGKPVALTRDDMYVTFHGCPMRAVCTLLDEWEA